jgi:hypothetical protein
MQLRIAAGCAVAVLACSHRRAPDSGDNTADGGDNTADGDNAADGGHGAPVPTLVSVSPPPGTAVWLHEPVRFVFDQPLSAETVAAARVAAAIDGDGVSASLVLEAPDTLSVVVDSSVRGVGVFTIEVTGLPSGGRGAADPPTSAQGAVRATYDLMPWSGVTIDPGTAAESPAIAVDGGGAVLAAWTVDAPGAHRVVVGRLARGAWQVIGDPLGSDASSAAIALDATGAAVVAWIDAGVARVARWDGTDWHELASPGRGSAVALAQGRAGDPIVAVFGASAAVRALAAGGWQPVGSDLAIARPFVGTPVLAVGDAVAIGWIDSGGQLRVFRGGSPWTAVAPIAVVPPPRGVGHLSLAARGHSLAVAWDAWAGSSGVLAAQLTGDATAWTLLGHALDVDIADDATGPAIAIDGSGAPVVAWTERIGANQRGVAARYAGRWTIVGGATFLGDPRATPSAMRLVLAEAQTPVVSWAANGAAFVRRFNGPAVASAGIAARASLAGCGITANAPPALLSSTGCFTLAGPGLPTPHAGLVPYGVVNELWSDGAHKRRWIGLPDGAPAMTVSDTGAWTAPAGTLLVKEFALETSPGDAATGRAIETRLLVNDPALGWQGFSYRWRADGSDATLQPDEAQTIEWPLDDGSSLPHVYPSRSHCLSCHESSYGPLLGLRAAQLQRWVDYDGVIADQISTLAHLGIGPASNDPPLISPYDPSQTIEHRMRGYMAANCAHCHNPNHIAIKDLRFTTPLADTRLCEAVVPGSPARSVVYQKVSSRPGMPALGTAVVDPLAVALVGEWIAQLTSCP